MYLFHSVLVAEQFVLMSILVLILDHLVTFKLVVQRLELGKVVLTFQNVTLALFVLFSFWICTTQLRFQVMLSCFGLK